MGDNAIVDGIAVKLASPFVQRFIAHPLQDDITILEEELHMVDNVFCASDKAGVKDAQSRDIEHGFYTLARVTRSS